MKPFSLAALVLALWGIFTFLTQPLPQRSASYRLKLGLVTPLELQALLADKLDHALPPFSRVLTQKEEKKLLQAISGTLGLATAVELDGHRLNHQLGRIGLEQHLPRFPGDTIAGHLFPEVGLTANRGAWGYFDDPVAERYYVAVQTFYLPNWNQDLRALRDWYRHRKVLVVNPATGQAVVAVIGDAGPAVFTGKQFGGSPEVMHALGFSPGPKQGRVVLLFVDDPQDQIPLGPVAYPFSSKSPVKT